MRTMSFTLGLIWLVAGCTKAPPCSRQEDCQAGYICVASVRECIPFATVDMQVAQDLMPVPDLAAPDLTGVAVDMAVADMAADLKGVDLRGVDLRGVAPDLSGK